MRHEARFAENTLRNGSVGTARHHEGDAGRLLSLRALGVDRPRRTHRFESIA
jgi:hypothetical protein